VDSGIFREVFSNIDSDWRPFFPCVPVFCFTLIKHKEFYKYYIYFTLLSYSNNTNNAQQKVSELLASSRKSFGILFFINVL